MANKPSNIKERILQLTDYKGVSKEKFFEKIGMSYGNFKGKSKETPLNSKAIENIFTIYPDINLEWLLTGKGEMIKKKEEENSNKEENPELIDVYKDKIMDLQDEVIRLNRKIETITDEHNALKSVSDKPNRKRIPELSKK